MQLKSPKNDAKYHWTSHVGQKMMYYGLSADRVKRVIRSPYRCEKGIAPDTIAVMSPSGRSRVAGQPWKEEIWVMYAEKKTNNRQLTTNNTIHSGLSVVGSRSLVPRKKVIITAWRYPGKSPVRDAIPIPNSILEELKSIKY